MCGGADLPQHFFSIYLEDLHPWVILVGLFFSWTICNFWGKLNLGEQTTFRKVLTPWKISPSPLQCIVPHTNNLWVRIGIGSKVLIVKLRLGSDEIPFATLRGLYPPVNLDLSAKSLFYGTFAIIRFCTPLLLYRFHGARCCFAIIPFCTARTPGIASQPRHCC